MNTKLGHGLRTFSWVAAACRVIQPQTRLPTSYMQPHLIIATVVRSLVSRNCTALRRTSRKPTSFSEQVLAYALCKNKRRRGFDVLMTRCGDRSCTPEYQLPVFAIVEWSSDDAALARSSLVDYVHFRARSRQTTNSRAKRRAGNAFGHRSSRNNCNALLLQSNNSGRRKGIRCLKVACILTTRDPVQPIANAIVWSRFIPRVNMANLRRLPPFRRCRMPHLQMRRLFAKFDQHRELWASAVRCLAHLDALLSLADVSSQPGFSRPKFHDGAVTPAFIRLKNARHPCLAQTYQGGEYIPNHAALGVAPTDVVDDAPGAPNMLLLTGPNMGGKSTLLRQTCLVAILAQASKDAC